MCEHMDTEDLQRRINSGELKLTGSTSCIESGNLTNNTGESVKYEITHGWDIFSANSCDHQWGSFNINLLNYIKEQNYSEEELDAVLSGIQIHDSHWDWFKKSCIYSGDEYEWFYMFANGKPQGACLIYHPKDSIIDSQNIFYIEFLAVAPWNRNNPMSKREFKGIGSMTIKCVLDFAVNTLHLKQGFSLHSVPQAKGFYEKIGMKNYPERDKDSLAYFEMPRAKSAEMLGVA
jgi:hypothetical protein